MGQLGWKKADFDCPGLDHLQKSNALNMGVEKSLFSLFLTGKGATKVTLKFSRLILALSLVEIRLKTKHCTNFHLGTVTHCLNF